MKRKLLAGLLALVLVPGMARAATIGIGAYGGISSPLVQDDNGSGTLYGLRVPVNFVPLISVEPYYAKTSGGSTDYTAAGVSYTRDGIDMDSYGANVLFMFGTGLQFYPFVGISSNHMKRPALDSSETGYDFGLGLGFKLPLAGLSADIRATGLAVTDPANSQASRKWGEFTIGVAYSLFHFPAAP
ncbi:MAG: outer membrane beta-barrel protein [Candidatus Eiseniibacteriota bacterium]